MSRVESGKVEKLTPIAVDFNGDDTYATCRPAPTTFDGNWFEKWYNDDGGKEYYMIDANTDEGRTEIAEFNGFKKEWAEKKYDINTAAWRKNHDLALLVAKKGVKGNVYVGPREGMHRCQAIATAMLAGRIDPYTGVIKPGRLQYADFADVNLVPVEDSGLGENIQEVLESVLTKKQLSPMLTDVTTVTGTYINTKDGRVRDITAQMRILSKATSNNKRASVTKGTFVLIGEYLTAFVNSASEHNMKCNPDMHKYKVPAIPRVTKTNAFKQKTDAITARRAEAKGDETASTGDEYDEYALFSLAPITQDPVMQAYVMNPFSEENKTKMMELLTFDSIGHDKTGDVEQEQGCPPFFTNFNSLASDTGSLPDKSKHMTTEVANSYTLIPPLMYFLDAGSKNKAVDDVVGDKNSSIVKMINYVIRYHVGSAYGPAALKSHGAISAVYELTQTPSISESPNQIMGAAIFIADMVNTILATPTEGWKDKAKHLVKIKEKTQEGAQLIGTTFSTMDIKSGMPDVDSATIVLGTPSVLFLCPCKISCYSINFVRCE